MFPEECYFFLFGRCVSAEAAAVLAAALDFGLRSTLLAALAARLLVTSLFPFLATFLTPFRESIHRLRAIVGGKPVCKSVRA